MTLPAAEPMVQKYKDPYYQLGAQGEHYVMSGGIRSRHATSGEAWGVIEKIRRRRAAEQIEHIKKEDHGCSYSRRDDGRCPNTDL